MSRHHLPLFLLKVCNPKTKHLIISSKSINKILMNKNLKNKDL